MPFTLGQMFGGWGKKGAAKKAPRVERARSSKSERLPERESVGAPRVREGGLRSSETADASSKSGPKAAAVKGESNLAWEMIVAPHISEKATMQGDGKYIFKVSGKATKGTVKQAIEERYKVDVDSLNILNMPSKKRRRGNMVGLKAGFKKAIVALKEGQTISEF